MTKLAWIFFSFLYFLNSSNAEEVTIGAMLPLTGELAMSAAALKEGIELAVDEENSQITDSNLKLKLVIEDSQFLPKNTITIANRFKNVPNLIGVLCGTYPEAKPSGRIFEQAKIPLIVLWDATPDLDEMGDYIFGIGPWLPATYEISEQFATTKLKAKTAGVLFQNSDWSLKVAEGFKQRFQRNSGKVVFYEGVNPEDTDFRTLLIKLKGLNPDVLYAPITNDFMSLSKQLKQLNIQTKIVTSDILNEEMINQAPKFFEGVYQSMVADLSGKKYEAFSAKYTSKFHKPLTLSMLVAWGYDGAKLLIKAAKDVGSNREKIKDRIYQFQNFSGASGVISISTEGSSRAIPEIFQVQNAKLVLISP